jgi:hypothetical protein
MTTLTLQASAVLAAMLASMESNTQRPESAPDQALRPATIVLNGDIATVFPLFGPIEEKKWSRGWDPQIVAGGASLQDTVFTYSHDGLTATWIVTEWDESRHRVTYAVFVPENRAMTIRIACTPEGAKTRATVTYTFTALSQAGNNALHDFEQQDFSQRILHWQKAIDHYLKTGTQWEGDSH